IGEMGEISGNTLVERQKIRGSYMETQMQNKKDQEAIASSQADFSGISIACLGDSITEAANLSDRENYQQYSYPTRLKELLHAESVTNLGIGGSSIGRYWANAFVDRYKEIPADTDLILVMGGTNDGFCMSGKDIGTMEERKAGTFIGDLDELMRGLKEDYPQAEIVFVTPLPNVLHDMLKKEKDYLLPQSALVDVIIQLATEYDIPVIDLYNSNILDTHDAAVIYNYMPDGVHCNPDGYFVLAEHIAAELIKMYDGEVPKGQE
ncbi:MAG: SGNH/GDSL hydrolase family protein, partial [Lachnospiraceae bacterium]|nr:SGNH/GDSL hydrolase family protein [Lachnospiraceae bacterium]